MRSCSSFTDSSVLWRRHAATLALAACLTVACAVTGSSRAGRKALPDFTELVDKVGPAVVNIRTTERAARRGARGDGPTCWSSSAASASRRRAGRIAALAAARTATPQPRGVGSGFILNADGYVLTNAHVVDGADEVIVTLTDKREFKAKIIGADKRSDVALVRIDATACPRVRIGDVSKLKVGEWVIAIGSPFGLESTVTAGIVSAKSRDTGELLPLIQTDVAINPGNSGGPLINMRGEVVGINSQIYSRSGGYQGISFAIPIDEAARVFEQLRASGRVIRGRIGVVIDRVTKEVAESIGLGKPMGALVRRVEAGGPAEKAGVEAGDIITKVDGNAIEKSSRPAAHHRQASSRAARPASRSSARRLPRPAGDGRRSRAGSRAKGAGRTRGPSPQPRAALGIAASRSDRRPEARAEDQERRSGRDGRGRRCTGRAA